MSSEQDTEQGSLASGESAPTAASLTTGDRIGRYVIIDRLGQGGMGVVWSAYDPELDRKVAIKVLHAAPRSEPQQIDRAFGKVMNALFGDEPASPGAVAATDRGQQRLLREAQAAARINDDNVVTVHDVGQHEGRVFIAMEFVVGWTLRQWLGLRERSWREVVDVMVRAASGLAAAHESGLVHRDFKPDNLMIGRDGRVRVMDFGLVRPDEAAVSSTDDALRPTTDALALDLTRGGGTMGTPAYMSPEQHLGLPVDARSDQFSFCIALWEALYGVRPFDGASVPALVVSVTTGTLTSPEDTRRVPSQLRRLVERGLAVERDARWPNMRALALELQRDPTRLRRRVVAGLVVAGAIAIGVGAWQIDRARDLAVCHTEAEAIATHWSDDVREKVGGALVGSGAVYAADSTATVSAMLDVWTDQWSVLREDTCTAVVRGDAPSTAAETIVCLDDGVRELDDVVATLIEADAATVRRAVSVTAGLEPPGDCIDPAALQRRQLRAGATDETHALRDRIHRAELERMLGRHEGAKQQLLAIVEEAKAIDATAVEAVATNALAVVLERLGDYAGAERALIDAVFVATAAGDEHAAANATIELIGIVAHRLARPDDATLWERWAIVLVDRLGAREQMLGAALEDMRGQLSQVRGEFADAAAHVQHALAIKRSKLGGNHPELASTLVTLGNAQMQGEGVDAAAVSWEEALALLERSLGPSHPDLGPVLSSLAQAAFRRGNATLALAYLERAIAIATAETGENHPEVAKLVGNLAVVLQLTGDFERARDAAQRSVRLLEASLGPEHRSVAVGLNTLGSLELALEHYDEALAVQQRALAIQERLQGPEHIDVAVTCGSIGSAYRNKGDLDAAVKWYERALAITEKNQPGGHPIHTPTVLVALGELARLQGRFADAVPLLERGLATLEVSGQSPEAIGEARFTLGFALWDQPGQRARARREIATAREQLAAAEKTERVAEIDAWLAAHAD